MLRLHHGQLLLYRQSMSRKQGLPFMSREDLFAIQGSQEKATVNGSLDCFGLSFAADGFRPYGL